MPKFQIRYALSGSFGGVENAEWEVIEAKDEQAAGDEAWERACEVYDSYAGLHGLRDADLIMEEDGVDEDEAIEIFREEREGWLDYEVRPFKDTKS